MPLEVEAKMKLQSHKAVEARLAELGTDDHVSLFEINRFYDAPDSVLRRSGQGLRVRVEIDQATDQSKVIITHKGPRQPGRVKTREETQITVNDAGAASELLSALGLELKLQFEKRRRRYVVDNCLVELDILPVLGEFVEVEGPDEQAVLAVRSKLNLADTPLISESYADLVGTHLDGRGDQAASLCFDR